jgi:prevent-host-death family protein
MEQIGVRELRQHASRYLARVARGEVIEVTDRGTPVARLVPIAKDPIQELLDSGRMKEAEDPGAWRRVEPRVYPGIDSQALLDETREDRL